MRNRTKAIVFSLSGAAAVLIAALTVVCVTVFGKPASVKIYEDASRQVVELKAQTGEDAVSYGSAVLIDGDGYFISNAHVVTYIQLTTERTFERYYIRFSFETDYRTVDLVVYDTEKDLSILKLRDKPGFKLKPVKIADTKKLKAGSEVYAVGNGMNHGVSMTRGIISLPRVNIEYDGKTRSALQCDLIINEGNSGGALLDGRGGLLGITTFRIKDAKGNPIYGIAFCVPSDVVSEFLRAQNIEFKRR